MENSIDTARKYYLSKLQDSKYKNTVKEAVGEFENTLKVQMTAKKLYQLMVDYAKEIK